MRMTRTVLLLTIVLLGAGESMAADDRDRELTLARTDVLYRASGYRSLGTQITIDGLDSNDRSVPKAFALSALVPGAGQVYNGSWWKAGVAVAAEAALLTAYVVWRNKGNDGVDVYQAYAHQNWNPAQYAEWLNAYSGYPGPDIELPPLSDSDFMHPETWTAEQEAQVDALFEDIRAAERQSFYLQTGAGFSHVLPYFGEQQYYELIGKYFQYAPGWVDYAFDPDAHPATVMPDDADFYYYSEIHAEANDHFRRSSWVGAIVILNHFASAIEAAVSAKKYNMSLRPKTSMRFGPLGDPMAMAGVAVTF